MISASSSSMVIGGRFPSINSFMAGNRFLRNSWAFIWAASDVFGCGTSRHNVGPGIWRSHPCKRQIAHCHCSASFHQFNRNPSMSSVILQRTEMGGGNPTHLELPRTPCHSALPQRNHSLRRMVISPADAGCPNVWLSPLFNGVLGGSKKKHFVSP